MSEYKGQLNAWSWQTALEAAKAGVIKPESLADLKLHADEIAAIHYVPEKDFIKTVQYLGTLFDGMEDPLSKIDELLNELTYMREQVSMKMEAHIAAQTTTPNAETVQ